MDYRIDDAVTAEDMETVRALFREYQRQLGIDLCFQGFNDEVDALPGKYGPPDGALLLCRVGGETAGCVALRNLGKDLCEMKRLYVRPDYRGRGLGRKLALAVISRARLRGYASMRLDTLSRMSEALGLYQSLGFHVAAPYVENPLPDVVYMELAIA